MRVLALAASLLVVTTALAAPARLLPSEVKLHPDRYDGTQIAVRGYILLGTNGRSVCDSEEAFTEWLNAFENHRPEVSQNRFEPLCLTLLNADALFEHRALFYGKTATFTGRFIKDYPSDNELDLQAWGKGALILDSVVLKRTIRALQSTR